MHGMQHPLDGTGHMVTSAIMQHDISRDHPGMIYLGCEILHNSTVY